MRKNSQIEVIDLLHTSSLFGGSITTLVKAKGSVSHLVHYIRYNRNSQKDPMKSTQTTPVVINIFLYMYKLSYGNILHENAEAKTTKKLRISY